MTAAQVHEMPEKGRFRFGIKMLLAVMTVACIVLSLVAKPIVEERSRQALLNELTGRGAKVTASTEIPAEKSIGRGLLSIFSSRYSRHRLSVFDLSGTTLNDEDLQRVAKVYYIKQLGLNGLPITDTGLSSLRSLPYLSNLDLGGTKVTDEGIVNLDTLSNLCTLRVTGTGVSYAALGKLDAKLPYAHFCEDRAIEELKMAGVQVVGWSRSLEGDAEKGMTFIDAGDQADYVVVGMNRRLTLTTADISRLNYLSNLRQMIFHTITLGAGGLEQLEPLPKLKDLEVWNVNLTDRDLEAIGQQMQLESLILCRCRQITNDGLKHLESLKQLRRLTVSDCDLTTKQGIAALRRALPECKCNYDNYEELQRELRASSREANNP